MAAKLPVLKGETKTCSLMAWGYDPRIASASPYHGAVSAVIESLVKVVIAGGSRKHAWFTYQEYFPRTQGDPQRWGLPAAALLGALDAQIGLEVGSIGGKDSMSGTFEDIDVPPTLVSFAVSTAKWDKIVSTEMKKPGEKLYLFCPEEMSSFVKMSTAVSEARCVADGTALHSPVGICGCCLSENLDRKHLLDCLDGINDTVEG